MKNSTSIIFALILQVREANLDIIMDKMRQDSSEQVKYLFAVKKIGHFDSWSTPEFLNFNS